MVFRARDTKLERDVALKLIAVDGCQSATQRKRFEREAVALATLRHPHIVPVHSMGIFGGQPYERGAQGSRKGS